MNILLVRIGRLGDIVMMLPALNEIIRLHPGATIYAITSADGLRLLKAVGLPEKNIVVYRNNISYRLLDIPKIRRFIAQHKFDHVFCFESKKRTVSWLPSHATIMKKQLTEEHYAIRCLKLVNPCLEQLHQNNYLSFNPNKARALDAILKEHQVTPKTLLIGFHPTYSGYGKWGKKNEKRHRLWSASNFSNLSIKLADYAAKKQVNLKIVMDLLPNERPMGLEIKRNGTKNMVLLTLEPDFQRYLCFIHRLNVLIAPNTGVMHLAAALGTPTVALFSDLSPTDCGPYMAKEKCVVLRAEETDMPEKGLDAISVDLVLNNTIQLLESNFTMKEHNLNDH